MALQIFVNGHSSVVIFDTLLGTGRQIHHTTLSCIWHSASHLGLLKEYMQTSPQITTASQSTVFQLFN